jgi:hypothetical protein
MDDNGVACFSLSFLLKHHKPFNVPSPKLKFTVAASSLAIALKRKTKKGAVFGFAPKNKQAYLQYKIPKRTLKLTTYPMAFDPIPKFPSTFNATIELDPSYFYQVIQDGLAVGSTIYIKTSKKKNVFFTRNDNGDYTNTVLFADKHEICRLIKVKGKSVESPYLLSYLGSIFKSLRNAITHITLDYSADYPMRMVCPLVQTLGAVTIYLAPSIEDEAEEEAEAEGEKVEKIEEKPKESKPKKVKKVKKKVKEKKETPPPKSEPPPSTESKEEAEDKDEDREHFSGDLLDAPPGYE